MPFAHISAPPADTAALENVETTALPDLAPTQSAAELAWSAALPDDEPGPQSWRAACRAALATVAVCTAIAGAISVALQERWVASEEYRGVQSPAAVPEPATPEQEPPPVTSFEPPVPTTLAASPNTAEYLRPPEPPRVVSAGPGVDAAYLATLQGYGLTITDPNLVIAGAKLICGYIGQGHSRLDAANAVMSDNSTLRPIDAWHVVMAAVSAYCPDLMAGS